MLLVEVAVPTNPVAVAPGDEVPTTTFGISPYSSPPSVTLITLTPSFSRIAVANPPYHKTFTLLIVTIGDTVYPNPGFVIKILSIDCPACPSLLVIIATAVALTP